MHTPTRTHKNETAASTVLFSHCIIDEIRNWSAIRTLPFCLYFYIVFFCLFSFSFAFFIVTQTSCYCCTARLLNIQVTHCMQSRADPGLVNGGARSRCRRRRGGGVWGGGPLLQRGRVWGGGCAPP